MEQPELLPCPFCGSESVRVIRVGIYDVPGVDEYFNYFAKCVACSARGPSVGGHERFAVDRWNTRESTEKGRAS